MAKTKQVSVILYLSRPMREMLRKFSFALLITLALFMFFVEKVESPFTHSVRLTLMDGYSAVAQYAMLPVAVLMEGKKTIGNYFFVYSKNTQLVHENQQLRRGVSLLSEAKVENEKLKALLHFVQARHYVLASANVVGDASGPFLRSLLINAGEKDGIEKGLAVVGEAGLVGRTLSVGKISTHILLITDVNSNIPVTSSLSRQRSVLAGNNTQYPALLYLPKDTPLKEGEEMVTSGDGGVFPPGLPVGLVMRDHTGNFYVKPHVIWAQLEHVSVIKMARENEQNQQSPDELFEPLLSEPYSTYN